jgi:hypothetical protein
MLHVEQWTLRSRSEMTAAGPLGGVGRVEDMEAGGVLAAKDFAGSVIPFGQLVGAFAGMRQTSAV